MNTFQTLLKLSRPRFWFYLAGPYLIGYTAGSRGFTNFSLQEFSTFFLFFLIPANIFLYGVNDLFDEDTDKLNEKKKHQETFVTDSKKKIYLASVVLSLIIAVVIMNHQLLSVWNLMGLFLLLSFFYSAPPLRFKAKPLVDSASNILYGIPAIIGFAQSSNEIPSVIIWIGIFCWTFAMHLFSAIPDIKPDTEAGIRTTATWLGKKNSLILCSLMWLVSASIASSFSPFLAFSFIYPIIPAVLIFHEKYSISRVYWWFPWINAVVGFLLFVFTFLTS